MCYATPSIKNYDGMALAVYENLSAIRQLWHPLPTIFVGTEVALNLLGSFALLYAIHLFIRLTIFHRNLTVLLVNLLVAYLLRCFLRITSCAYTILQAEGLLGGSHTFLLHLDILTSTSQYVCSVDLFFIFLERVHATIRLSKYEYWNNDCSTSIVVAVMWCCTWSSMYLTTTGYLSIYVDIAFCALILIMSAVGFVVLFHLNHRLYGIGHNQKMNLSYRYQISENIRSFRLLIPTLALMLSGCFACLFEFIGMGRIQNPVLRDISGILFNLTVSGGSIVLPIVILASHHLLRRNALTTLCKRKTRVALVSNRGGDDYAIDLDEMTNSTSVGPIGLYGDPVIVGRRHSDARRIYFGQLERMWNY